MIHTSSFIGLIFEEAKAFLVSQGLPSFSAQQVWDWIYQKGISDWSLMTNLSKLQREKIAQQVPLFSLQQLTLRGSLDGETTKFLWQLSDGSLIESVLIYSENRRTVCVSVQVGCPARCAFCASGKEGFFRNLDVGEIVEQVLHIDRTLRLKGERVSHVVFMGMGEPLENYDNVMKALEIMNHPRGLNISQRRITVSTVGIVENIYKFADSGLKVNLVLSLHAPNQQLRKKIIPYARRYELKEILEAMNYFAHKTKRDVTFEYTLLKGINDQKEHAVELATLIQPFQCTVNLIPYNPVIGLRLSRPDSANIEMFREVLDRRGIINTCRYTKGEDIAAACGQLARLSGSSSPKVPAPILHSSFEASQLSEQV